MRILILTILFISGCGLVDVPAPDGGYQLTAEEVAYMAGCTELGAKMKIKNFINLCADMDYEFIKRHKGPRE